MFKRLTALLMVLVLVLGMVSAASATESKAEVDARDITIQGSNSFGNLLSEDISKSQEEMARESTEYPGGYTVTDLEIVGSVATVTYDSMEEATLVVALYTEDGMRMVTSATATVTPDATTATVTFEEDMPEYFLVSAYLLDSYDLSPLCAAYDTPMYTREMQELLASTVNDYAPEKVLNLDDDETTNFAVYANSTIIIEAVEGVNTVASIDDENATYVIKNADEQITSLATGDVFAYPYAENELLIVKVASITVDETTATITGAEVEMDEVFSHVKVDGMMGTEGVEVDDSTADEGITYRGKSSAGGGTAPGTERSTMTKPNGEISNEIVVGFDYEAYEKGVFSVKGKVDVTVKAGVEYYITWSYQRIEVKVDFGAKVGFEIEVLKQAKLKEFRMAALRFPVLPGVTVTFTPTLVMEFSVTVSGEMEFLTTVGFGFEHDNQGGRFLNLCTTPNAFFDAKLEGKIFIGFKLTPAVKILEGVLASAEVSGEVGFEITGTMLEADSSTWGETKHDCIGCIDGNVSAILKTTPSIQFLKSKKLKFSTELLNVKWDLFDFYICAQHLDIGLGECPWILNRVTVEVTGPDGALLPEATVTANKESIAANENGIAVFYLADGSYSIEATDGELTKSRTITVDEAQKVTIKLTEDTTDDTHIFDIVGSEISIDNSITGSGEFGENQYQLFDVSMTWPEAKAYCESLGGHLVTITSAEEQAYIESLMEYGGKKQYWIGMQNMNGRYQWITGEPVSFSKWDQGQPDHSTYGSLAEDYIHILNQPNPVSWYSQRFHWNDMYFDNNFRNADESNFFSTCYVGFICEFEANTLDPRVTFNNHAYYLIDNHTLSWDEALSCCESMGGHLATISSREENNFLYEYVSSCGYENAYFGLSDVAEEGHWEWCTGEDMLYENWAPGQPDGYGGNDEDFGMFWYASTDGSWHDGHFTNDNFALICEWDSIEVTNDIANIPITTSIAITPNAVYPGDYGTEITEEYTLKTASFADLVPDEQYVLLAMASIEIDDPLASDNLLFIDQAEALEDGTLVFQYIQRMPCEISYVVACGASHKNLRDAKITFPEMMADGELQSVAPVVVYGGETLVEGRDYVIVGTVDFTEAGEYTCAIRGIHNYTGLVECTYTVSAPSTEIASGWSGRTQWTLTSDGTLTVYGDGNMKNYGFNGGQPWMDKGVDITKVIIEEGVTAVGTGAFRNLITLESVIMPESGLTKVGEAAFYGCTALKKITIPEGIYTIWAYTFKGCSSLESVKLPKTLIKIDQGAFENCTALPYIYIPGDTEIIGSWSFKGCTALTEADMTWADATEIREGAFKNCTTLSTIHLPGDIRILGDSAFYGIGAEIFTVPATITKVGPWCFARAALTTITFEGDAPAIGEGAFNKIALTVYYPGDNPTWTADIMQNYGGTIRYTAMLQSQSTAYTISAASNALVSFDPALPAHTAQTAANFDDSSAIRGITSNNSCIYYITDIDGRYFLYSYDLAVHQPTLLGELYLFGTPNDLAYDPVNHFIYVSTGFYVIQFSLDQIDSAGINYYRHFDSTWESENDNCALLGVECIDGAVYTIGIDANSGIPKMMKYSDQYLADRSVLLESIDVCLSDGATDFCYDSSSGLFYLTNADHILYRMDRDGNIEKIGILGYGIDINGLTIIPNSK